MVPEDPPAALSEINDLTVLSKLPIELLSCQAQHLVDFMLAFLVVYVQERRSSSHKCR